MAVVRERKLCFIYVVLRSQRLEENDFAGLFASVPSRPKVVNLIVRQSCKSPL